MALAAALLAAGAAWGGELNNPCTPDEPQPDSCWEWDGTNCVWVYCPDAKPGDVCCVVDGACKIYDEHDPEGEKGTDPNAAPFCRTRIRAIPFRLLQGT